MPPRPLFLVPALVATAIGAAALGALLGPACARRSHGPPALPAPPPAAAPGRFDPLPFERAGFFFVIPAEHGVYLQIGKVSSREAADAPPEKFPPTPRRLLPELVLTLSPGRTPVPEVHGREYGVWRGVRPLCRGTPETSVFLGRLKPDHGEWDTWGVDPWEPARPPLGTVGAKMPLPSLWHRSRKVTAAWLPGCAHPPDDDDSLLWARPSGLPPPPLYVPDAEVDPVLEKAAVARVREAGFDDKVAHFRRTAGAEPELEPLVSSFTLNGVTLVEVHARVFGGSECGDGSRETWGLFRVDDQGMTTLVILESRRTLRLAGDLDGDGALELVVQGGHLGKTLVLYKANGQGGILELQRSTYPTPGSICGP